MKYSGMQGNEGVPETRRATQEEGGSHILIFFFFARQFYDKCVTLLRTGGKYIVLFGFVCLTYYFTVLKGTLRNYHI